MGIANKIVDFLLDRLKNIYKGPLTTGLGVFFLLMSAIVVYKKDFGVELASFEAACLAVSLLCFTAKDKKKNDKTGV